MGNVLLFCMYSISQKDVHVSRSLSSNQVECIICITCIICIACIVCSGGCGGLWGDSKRPPPRRCLPTLSCILVKGSEKGLPIRTCGQRNTIHLSHAIFFA